MEYVKSMAGGLADCGYWCMDRCGRSEGGAWDGRDGVGLFFCFKETGITEIYTLSLQEALARCGRGGE